jgi:hypothetical protein
VPAIDDVPAQLTVGRLYEGSGLIPGFCIGQMIGNIKKHGGVQGLLMNGELGLREALKNLGISRLGA